MVKDLVRDKCGLGLTILDDVVGRSVVGINITATKIIIQELLLLWYLMRLVGKYMSRNTKACEAR